VWTYLDHNYFSVTLVVPAQTVGGGPRTPLFMLVNQERWMYSMEAKCPVVNVVRIGRLAVVHIWYRVMTTSHDEATCEFWGTIIVFCFFFWSITIVNQAIAIIIHFGSIAIVLIVISTTITIVTTITDIA
jgi:hypothetical protein